MSGILIHVNGANLNTREVPAFSLFLIAPLALLVSAWSPLLRYCRQKFDAGLVRSAGTSSCEAVLSRPRTFVESKLQILLNYKALPKHFSNESASGTLVGSVYGNQIVCVTKISFASSTSRYIGLVRSG